MVENIVHFILIPFILVPIVEYCTQFCMIIVDGVFSKSVPTPVQSHSSYS